MSNVLDILKDSPRPEGIGPRGGDATLSHTLTKPEWKKESFNGSAELPHKFRKLDTNTATHALKNEQPWHRMAAYMLNAGKCNEDIAMAAGVGCGQVSILRQQVWFQQLCARIATKHGENILGLLEAEATRSIETLVSLRDTAENENVQLNAARTLLEQAHGKPIQKIIASRGPDYRDPEQEVRELTEELQNIRKARESGS